MADNLYISELDRVADDDISALHHAQKNYGNSWKKRGGVGAFMMLARKWDRLETRLSNPPSQSRPLFSQYDIFGAVETDARPEGVIDDIRDLRRYLMLVEAELRARGTCPGVLPKDIERGDASKGGACNNAPYVKRAEALVRAIEADQPSAGTLHPP
jgi:hypothetical protein